MVWFSSTTRPLLSSCASQNYAPKNIFWLLITTEIFYILSVIDKQAYLHFAKVKLSHYTPTEAQGESIYSSYSFTTSELDGGKWSVSCPGCNLTPGKGHQVSIVQEAGWPQNWSGHRGWRKNSLPLSGIEPRSSGLQVRSQTLCWLSYPGYRFILYFRINNVIVYR
jgi:hypothetical protein